MDFNDIIGTLQGGVHFRMPDASNGIDRMRLIEHAPVRIPVSRDSLLAIHVLCPTKYSITLKEHINRLSPTIWLKFSLSHDGGTGYSKARGRSSFTEIMTRLITRRWKVVRTAIVNAERGLVSAQGRLVSKGIKLI